MSTFVEVRKPTNEKPALEPSQIGLPLQSTPQQIEEPFDRQVAGDHLQALGPQ